MLILTRRQGEKLILIHQGTTIPVRAMDVKGRQVTAGVDARKGARIMRRDIACQNNCGSPS